MDTFKGNIAGRCAIKASRRRTMNTTMDASVKYEPIEETVFQVENESG